MGKARIKIMWEEQLVAPVKVPLSQVLYRPVNKPVNPEALYLYINLILLNIQNG